MAWKLDKPKDATVAGWREWREEAMATHPVKYFLQETLPDFIVYRIVLPIKRNFYGSVMWFKYRFCPNHQYHIVKPRTLKPGYHDPDNVMLASCFELLTQYVEHMTKYHRIWTEADLEECDPSDVKQLKLEIKMWNELQALYEWWNVIRPNRKEKNCSVPKEWGMLACFDKKYENTPEVKAWKKCVDENTKLMEQWDKEDEEMLIRLIKIRTFMWY